MCIKINYIKFKQSILQKLMPIGAIFATSIKGIFSLNGKLPWECPSDMQFFRRITTGTNIIMGRKTMESISKPLPKRQNYVLTRTDKLLIEGFVPITVEECLKRKEEEIFWIIGGKEVLEFFIDYNVLDVIVRTWIGDSYLSPISETDETINISINFESPMFYKESYEIDKDILCDIIIPYNRIFLPKSESLDDKYISIGKKILNDEKRLTRNGIVRSSFDDVISISASFQDGFPILQSKKVFWKGVLEEFKFFLSGKTDTNILLEKGVKIWEGNTSREFLDTNGKSHLKEGDMGPMYGFQLKHFGADYIGCDYNYTGLGIDQINGVINLIVKDSHSRRILMTTYNPSQASEGVLYPCHGLVTQFYVKGNAISLKTYQRSADWVLGVPFNISSYGLLLDYIVKEVNKRQDIIKYIPNKITILFGDSHIYECHVTAFLEQYIYYLLNIRNNLDKVVLNEEELENYNPKRVIIAKMVA